MHRQTIYSQTFKEYRLAANPTLIQARARIDIMNSYRARLSTTEELLQGFNPVGSPGYIDSRRRLYQRRLKPECFPCAHLEGKVGVLWCHSGTYAPNSLKY